MIKNLAFIMLFLQFHLACAYELAELEPQNSGGEPVSFHLPLILDSYPMRSSSFFAYSIYVPCTIEAHKGLCLFDSGATGLAVNSCLSKSEPWGDSRVIGAGGKKTTLKRKRIKEFVVGDAIYKQVKAVLIKNSKCTNKIGLIGHDLFEDKFYINSKQWILSSENPEILLDQPLYKNRGLLIIHVEINGTTVAALFDTGASTTFIDSKLAEKIAPNLPKLNDEKYKFADFVGIEIPVDKVVKTDLNIAGQTLSNIEISAINLAEPSKHFHYPLDMVIGMNVVKQMNWGFSKEEEKWGAVKIK